MYDLFFYIIIIMDGDNGDGGTGDSARWLGWEIEKSGKKIEWLYDYRPRL